MKKFFQIVSAVFICAVIVSAQATDKKSIGGKEHEANILGVTIGMDVPTALQAVFVNANRQPGQERPDAKRNEGKDKKDIRVVYKNLPQGELQILFADGKFVKEMILVYAKPPLLDDLRLPFTGSLGNSTSLITTSTIDPPGNTERGALSTNTTVLDGTKEIDGFNATNLANTDRRRGEALDGTRFDDRYTIAFTDNQKLQRLWWREEKSTQGYKTRVQFVAEKVTKAGANLVVKIAQKIVFLNPDDEKEFRKSLNLP
ncbi:MAG: hypothetical protein HC846_13205 [Blastocatellia bacterium]|nr:hypothetical protein [Blastocatellia bacterium]